MTTNNRNQQAINVLNKHIEKLEKNLKALVAALEFNHLDRLAGLRKELKVKIEQRNSGNITLDDFSAWLDKAANDEQECMKNLDPKLVEKRRERRYRLETELDSIRHSVWILSR